MSSRLKATVSKKRKGSSKSKKSTKKQKTEYYNLSKIMKEDVIVTAYYQNRSLVDVYLRLFSGCKFPMFSSRPVRPCLVFKTAN